MLRMCVLTGTGFSPYAHAFFDLRNFLSSVIGWRLMPHKTLPRASEHVRTILLPLDENRVLYGALHLTRLFSHTLIGVAQQSDDAYRTCSVPHHGVTVPVTADRG